MFAFAPVFTGFLWRARNFLLKSMWVENPYIGPFRDDWANAKVRNSFQSTGEHGQLRDNNGLRPRIIWPTSAYVELAGAKEQIMTWQTDKTVYSQQPICTKKNCNRTRKSLRVCFAEKSTKLWSNKHQLLVFFCSSNSPISCCRVFIVVASPYSFDFYVLGDVAPMS